MNERKKTHLFEKYLNKNVVIELKTGNKYFGKITIIDTRPPLWAWIIIVDQFGKETIFTDAEIKRVEVLK